MVLSKNIMIVDDHPMVLALMSQLITQEPGLEICAETGVAAEAISMVQLAPPDLAIIDISLEHSNGLDLIRRIRSINPSVKMLVCSSHDEGVYAPRVLDVGAMGYISKRESLDHLVTAIHHILEGKIWLSEAMRERIKTLGYNAPQPLGTTGLSNRELEVLRLIGLGKSTSQAGRELNLSVKTIETHREKLKRKLGLTSAGELNRYAVLWTLEQG